MRVVSVLNIRPCKVFDGFSPTRSTHLQGLITKGILISSDREFFSNHRKKLGIIKEGLCKFFGPDFFGRKTWV